MTVAELIKSLETIQDKSKTVYAFDSSTCYIYDVDSVDDNISDRVDINFIGV